MLFVLPLLNTPPIPQKTKGIIITTSNIFAGQDFEKFLILFNIDIF